MKFVKDYSSKYSSVDEKKLLDFISVIKEDLFKNYDSDFSSLLLPQDENILRDVSVLVKKKKKFSDLIVIGIGGSNLGALAILEAVKGKNYLLINNKKVFFADTVDSDNINNILSICKKKNFLLVFISKSGTTTESVANFEVLLSKIPLKQRKERVVTISDEGSALSVLADKKGFDSLFIPKKVGGRFSVFSSVGLFPLLFAGINVKELLRGANDSLKSFDKTNFAYLGALDIYTNYKKNKVINDLFLFSNDLESLGKWFRQLMGESIGKKFSVSGKKVFAGITPTVSVGSTDLHSVGQLYLGGPRDKFTSFVSLKNQSKLIIPKNKDGILKHIQGLSFQEVMDAILKGTLSAFKLNKLPFNHYVLEKKSEYEIGFFMQTKMLEIILLAHLIGVNPFDQPSVEDYKKETRKLLQ
ncbi:hypothetical protein KO361_03580 [Candidatus Woesearchaeota archaeon]|nr:hypothetical protein [Candidatus Woesearchaeota archaeon]